MKKILALGIMFLSTVFIYSQNTYPTTGNVGIGTTSPSYNLDIRDSNPTFQLLSTEDGSRRFRISVNDSDDEIQFMSSYGTLGVYPFTFRNTNGELFRIASNGNVGIGTTSPVGNLEVAATNGGVLSISTNGYNGNTTTPKKPTIDFLGYQDGNKARITALEKSYNSHGSQLSFFVNDGSSATSLVERLTILQNGYVGIGTETPIGRLHTKTGGNNFNIIENSVYGFVALAALQTSTNNTALFFDNAGDFSIRSQAKANMGTASGEIVRMVIDGNTGNVGIGTNNPTNKVDIGGTGIISGMDLFIQSPDDVKFSLYKFGGSSWTFTNNGSDLDINPGSQFTRNFNILNTGAGNIQVGIGTNSPTSRLDVNGKITLSSDSEHTIQKLATGILSGAEATELKGRNLELYAYDNVYLRAGTGDNILFEAGGSQRMSILAGGQVKIGTKAPAAYTYKLAVEGTIGCGEVIVEEVSTWSDFVFAKDYKLKELSEVENFIATNKHLPDVPSEQEVKEKGFSLAEMDATLLQKIEELTLYTIEQQKEIERLQKVETELGEIKELINQLKK